MRRSTELSLQHRRHTVAKARGDRDVSPGGGGGARRGRCFGRTRPQCERARARCGGVRRDRIAGPAPARTLTCAVDGRAAPDPSWPGLLRAAISPPANAGSRVAYQIDSPAIRCLVRGASAISGGTAARLHLSQCRSPINRRGLRPLVQEAGFARSQLQRGDSAAREFGGGGNALCKFSSVSFDTDSLRARG
jgi:hypothetical protein